LILAVFRDEVSSTVNCPDGVLWLQWLIFIKILNMQYVLLHEDYQLYVLPQILESKKMAKSGRTKQKEADLEYSVAKQVEKMIR
jgi:NCK-associated protein 1